MKPLKDLTVVELTTYWTAVTTGRYFRAMGARVIKVETPPGGDFCRYFGKIYKMPIASDENPSYDMYNGGKEAVALNLKDPEHMKVMLNMISKADVFLTSTREKGLVKLGLDWKTLHAKYPKLIMGHVTGWGLNGPKKDDSGLDAVAFFGANGLLTDTLMDEGGSPIYSPTGMGDLTTGTMLAVGVLAALHNRDVTGEGEYVMCSLNGTGSWVSSAVASASQYGYEWPRNAFNSGPLSQGYLCKDGKYFYSMVNEHERLWPAYSAALGLPEEMRKDPRYASRDGQLQPDNRRFMVETIREYAKKQDSEELYRKMLAGDVPCCVLAKYEDRYHGEMLEQQVSNGYLSEHTYPSGKSVYLNQMPIYFESEGFKDLYERSHAVGEDNEAIFKEFGE